MKIAYFLIVSIYAFYCPRCLSQTVYFDKSFNVNHTPEFGWSILINSDSNFLTLSNGGNFYSGDGSFAISFFSQSGGAIINKLYKYIFTFPYVGLSNTLLKSPNENGYIFGGSLLDNSTGISDNFFVKLNNEGDTVLVKKYLTSEFDALYSNSLTTDKKVVLIGFRGPVGEHSDVLLMKTDTNGNVIWEKEYGDSTNDLGFSIYQMGTGKYVIAAVQVDDLLNASPWIIFTDTAGNIISEKKYDTGALSCAGIRIITSIDNDLLIDGCLDTTINNGDYEFPYYIGKMDTNFNFKWMTIYNDPLQNGIYIVKQLTDSIIIFVGFQLGGNPNAPEGWIGKLDKNGNKLWEHQYRHNNSLFNYFSDFQQTNDGGYIITGSTDGPTGQDLWLVKLDSMGLLQPIPVNAGTIETGNVLSLECYPNPARLQATILYNVPQTAGMLMLRVNDLSGKLLKSIPLESSGNSYDLLLEQWSPGVYVCSLVVDDLTCKSVKLVVVK